MSNGNQILIRISKITLLIIVGELCLGGGGRLIAYGSVSLRMVLFAIGMLLTVFLLLNKQKLQPKYWWLLGVFVLVIIVGLLISFIHHSSRASAWEDIKPLLFFLMLPFFALTIDEREINSVSKIMKASSILLALLFFITLILIHSKAFPFLTFYSFTSKTQEFFYRGEMSFFYKGFLFLGVGSLFFLFSQSQRKYLMILILVLAIVLSVTRGLLFALSITLVIYFFQEKKYLLIAGALAIAIAIGVFGNHWTISLSRRLDSFKHEKSYAHSSPHLFGDRNYSDAGRVTQIKEVAQRISLESFFIGHGFGLGVPSRPVHMEIAYLEVFHKQGLIGLVFWGSIAWLIFRAYQESNKSDLANSFFYAAVFVFAESLTNQYFNNPIGMSVLLLSLVSLDQLKKPV